MSGRLNSRLNAMRPIAMPQSIVRVVLSAACAFAALWGFATEARAALVISSGPTTNVTCSHHVCTATASNAVLSIKTLKNQLAAANVKIASASVASDIEVDGTVTWVSSNTLTLDSYHSITIARPISVTGQGGLTLTTNDGGTGGTLSFVKPGKVNFWSLTSSLTINGAAYTLVNTLATLASGIASNPSGNFALAANYDATPDGTYGPSPIPTTYTGTFEGLGNTISNLTIYSSLPDLGLFEKLGSGGTLRDIGLLNTNVTKSIYVKSVSAFVGTLVGFSDGTIFGAFASGTMTAVKGSAAGGLVGRINSGSISNSYATTTVTVSAAGAGGLVGDNNGLIINCHAIGAISGRGLSASGGLAGANDLNGTISNSYSTGDVTGGGDTGGLVGSNDGAITDSYEKGAVHARDSGSGDFGGGLVGFNGGTVVNSYSTGALTGDAQSIGGSVGYDQPGFGSEADVYWNLTSSGITDTSRGAGNVSNDPGITGLTGAQFRSGLPTGFSSAIWGESSNINNGLPYLLYNPPG